MSPVRPANGSRWSRTAASTESAAANPPARSKVRTSRSPRLILRTRSTGNSSSACSALGAVTAAVSSCSMCCASPWRTTTLNVVVPSGRVESMTSTASTYRPSGTSRTSNSITNGDSRRSRDTPSCVPSALTTAGGAVAAVPTTRAVSAARACSDRASRRPGAYTCSRRATSGTAGSARLCPVRSSSEASSSLVSVHRRSASSVVPLAIRRRTSPDCPNRVATASSRSIASNCAFSSPVGFATTFREL